MNDPFSPEEFARLMALPEEHPDRRRAEASLRFEAAKRMLAEFERPGDALLSAADIAAAESELVRRLTAGGALGVQMGPATAPRALEARREATGWFGWMKAPAARGALVFASAVIVAGIGWLATHRGTAPEVMRGVAEQPPAFEMTARREGDALELSWTAVVGADAYRIVFLGADHAETTRLDVPEGMRFTLRATDLPAGVASGSTVLVEVVALRDQLPIATTPARTVLLP